MTDDIITAEEAVDSMEAPAAEEMPVQPPVPEEAPAAAEVEQLEDTPTTEASDSDEPDVPETAQPQVLPTEPETVTVADIQFRSGSKVYFFDPGELKLKSGDHVIMDTARGNEFGYCVGSNHTVSLRDIVPPLRKILRVATEKDEKINRDNIQKEKKAYEICQQKIQAHGLDMQLVSAECAFDGSKIIFFFTADGRVDFRELVKNLASVFRTRIELRQIGVRDKAKMVGGLGICGRPFCCKEFLDDFQPVSIKMAKTQNLSLNPTKISGTCGRLMCCLKYEQEAYEDLLKTSPKNESFVDTVDGRGTIIDVNLLRQTVRVRMEDQPDVINTYKNEDICVLRSGKARKNDPPIPKDVAPISSKPRPAKKLVELPDEPLPDVIIAGEMPQPKPQRRQETVPEKSEVSEKPEGSGNRRRRRKKPAAQSQDGAAPRQEGAQPQHRKPRTDRPQQDGKPHADRAQQDKPRQSHGEKQNRQPQQEQPPRSENKPQNPHSKSERPRQDKPRQPQGEKAGRPTEQQPRPEGAPHRRRRRPRSGPKPEGGAPKQDS